MRIIVRPAFDSEREIDVTHRVVAAVAEELWRVCGGDDRQNWMEAERHVRRLAAGASGRDVGGEVVTLRAEPVACPGCPKRRKLERPEGAGKIGIKLGLVG